MAFSDLADFTRGRDRDRFLCSLLAPARRQSALWTVLGFNWEIARIPDIVSQPILGQIRLAWWREALAEIFGDGQPRRHEIVDALAEAVRAGFVTQEGLELLLDGWERALIEEAPTDTDTLEKRLADTSGTLLDLWLTVLDTDGDDDRAAARHVGIAWGLVALLRALPSRYIGGKSGLPTSWLRDAGLDPEAANPRDSKGWLLVAERAVALAATHLAAARRLRRGTSRAALPALALARLADHHLNRIVRRRYDVFARELLAPSPFQGLTLLPTRWTGRY